MNDREYIVKIDDKYVEIKMASLLVRCLMTFNDGENRLNADMDKAFIKGLVIGFCTIRAIENGDNVHKDLLIFIRGSYRFCDHNESLYIRNDKTLFFYCRTVHHQNL